MLSSVQGNALHNTEKTIPNTAGYPAEKNARRKRQLMRPTNSSNESNFAVGRLWTPGAPISYTLDAALNDKAKRLIRMAAEFWTESTCISWAESGRQTSQRPIVQFIQGQGCYAEGLGRLNGLVWPMILSCLIIYERNLQNGPPESLDRHRL